jgi:small subunit ribosomal protein S24e
MSLKILEHRKNPLMKRDEVKAVIEHPGKPTPTRDEILPSLESVLKAGKDLIFIDRIFTEKGRGQSQVRVFLYERKEDIHSQDARKSEKRKAKAEGAAAAEGKKDSK